MFQDGKYYISCPTCRVDHLLPEGGAVNLPTAFQINSLLELRNKLKPTKISEQASVKCPIHNDILKVYCETCQEVICRDCTISIEHNTHNYHLISECYPKHHQQLQDSLDLVKYKLADIDTAVTCLTTRETEMLQQGEQLKEEIDTHAQEMIGQIQRSRTHLSQQVDTIVQRKAQILTAQREYAEKQHTEIKTCQETIEQTLKELNKQEILTKKDTMMHQMNKAIQSADAQAFQPIEKACIKFTKSTKNIDNEIGLITSPENNVKAIVTALPSYRAFELSTATLALQSQDGTPLSLPPSLISSTLSSPGVDKPPVKCDITQTHPGEYSITFTPSTRRHHQLVVQVGGADIPDSPFTLPVIPLPEMRGEPGIIITGLKEPSGIAVCDNGDIVVAESGAHCVTIFNKKGQKMRSFGTKGEKEGQFTRPYGVAISNNGYILVTDEHRLQKLTTNGVCVISVRKGTSGSGRLQFINHPRAIAVHPTTGQIFVADSNNNRIQVFNNDLTFSHNISGNTRHTKYSVAFDNDGHLHVAEWDNGCITVLTTSGQYITRYGSYGSAPGQLMHPSSLTIHNNLVYVTESINSRVSIFDTNGTFSCCFSMHGREEGELNRPDGIATDKLGITLYVSDTDNNRLLFL